MSTVNRLTRARVHIPIVLDIGAKAPRSEGAQKLADCAANESNAFCKRPFSLAVSPFLSLSRPGFCYTYVCTRFHAVR